MTGTSPERSFYRYFDLADCFVQIVALDEGALSLRERPGLGRAGYRKLVIGACMPEFRDDLDSRLERLFPDDPLMVEDLLYQLCVEVNPGLDIHEVRLTVGDTISTQNVEIIGDPLATISDTDRVFWHDLQVSLSHIVATTRAASASVQVLNDVRPSGLPQ